MDQMSQQKEQATSALMGAQAGALRGGPGVGGRPMPGTPEYEALMRQSRMT